MSTINVLGEIAEERRAQDAKWGVQNHPDGTGSFADREHSEYMRLCTQTAFASGQGAWRDVLEEEVYEALAEHDPALLRAELVQVAAVAVSWIEAIDRRQGEDDTERTATLRVGSWSSTCSACGGNASPHDTHHVKGGPKSMWDAESTLSKNNGCGARFVDRTDSYLRL